MVAKWGNVYVFNMMACFKGSGRTHGNCPVFMVLCLPSVAPKYLNDSVKVSRAVSSLGNRDKDKEASVHSGKVVVDSDSPTDLVPTVPHKLHSFYFEVSAACISCSSC